jgi:hypothetical protein
VASEIEDLRDQVAALTETVKLATSAAPVAEARYSRDARMQRIHRDRKTVMALVAANPDERCSILAPMIGTGSLNQLSEMLELDTILTIVRGMPANHPATLALINAISAPHRHRVRAALMATEHLPALIAVTNVREGSTFNMPGVSITAGCTALIDADLWSELSRKGGSPEVNAAIASRGVTYDDASEAQAREWLAFQLAAGTFVIGADGKLTTPRPFGAQAQAEAERPINVRASLDRVRAADRAAQVETTKQTTADQTSRSSAAERAKDREAARLARAICDEQDRRAAAAAKQPAAKKVGK